MHRLFLWLIVFTGATINSCSKKGASDRVTDLNNISFTVEEAPEWSALFKREKGWFGGDGIFTIPVGGSDVYATDDSAKTLIIFSDSMIGEIVQDSLQPGSRMIHNSVAILNGNQPDTGNIRFYWKRDEKGGAVTVFDPLQPPAEKGDYFWLGDGFTDPEAGGSIFIFAYQMRNTGSGTWGFKEVGNVLLELPPNSQPPYQNYTQVQTPFFVTDSAGGYGSFGTGVFANTRNAGAPNPDGFVYVYGMRGKEKNVMVARVKPADFKQFERWTYFNGKDWSTNISQAANITDSASNELSVTPLPDGRYAMIFQVNGISQYVGMRIGKTPYGPFGSVIRLWDCGSMIKNGPGKLFAYNAKAHPHLSKPGELLISYNVNSFDFFNDLSIHPTLYRPRFIRLKFAQ